MSIVNLPFLCSVSTPSFSFKDKSRLTVESERISYAVTREMVPWLLENRPFVRLTVGDLNKLILRAWLVILVGVVFTTEAFVCLLYVLFRRGLIHCITKAKSSTLLIGDLTRRTHSRELCIGLLR